MQEIGSPVSGLRVQIRTAVCQALNKHHRDREEVTGLGKAE